jgi:Txe/YoeB family toxin of Txe-Axe toxin-antitoxin module
MGTKFRPIFNPRFKKEFDWFLNHDSAKADKIKDLMADTLEHPTYGPGHPEHLRHLGENIWSRHTDKKNRLRYSIKGFIVCFEPCPGHYKNHSCWLGIAIPAKSPTEYPRNDE